MTEISLWTRLIVGLLCFRIMAAHVPMTALWFLLGVFVFVKYCNTFRRVGAFFWNSFVISSHLNESYWSLLILFRREFTLSEHMVATSDEIVDPNLFIRYFFILWSLIATAFWLPLATLFAIFFLDGVNWYFTFLWYFTST